jgi:HK97 family phage major capsid protein
MKQLLEKRQKLIADFEARQSEAKSILDGDFDQDGYDTAKSLLADCEGLKAQIEDLNETLRRLDANQQFTSVTLPHSGPAIHTGNAGNTHVTANAIDHEGEGVISRKQWEHVNSASYKRALNLVVRARGDVNALDTIDYKTLTEGTDTQGGYLVPDAYVPTLITKAPAPTRVNGLVERIPCSGARLTMPRVVYSTDDIYASGIRVTLTGETPSGGSAHRVTDPVFGTVSINIGTWMLSMPITNDLIEDAAVPLLNWASGQFNDTIGLLFDNQILNGSGIGANPHGILKNPGGVDEPAVYLSSTANNLDADQIRGLPFRLPEQYINDNTRWVMNRASAGRTVATFKSSTNEYLWKRGEQLADGAPDTLDGYGIVYSAFCPNVGDEQYPVIFGDLRGYKLAVRTAFSIRVLEERYAEENTVVMLGRVRFGGVVAEPFRMVIAKSDNA